MSPPSTDHPKSLWAATAPPPPDTTPLVGEQTCDVAVVGAGITGLSTAIHLRERGIGCTVLEAARIGFGGSGRNSGHVIPTLAQGDPDHLVAILGEERGERMVAFIRDSANATFDLITRYGIDCEAVHKGWAQPAHRPSRLKLLESRLTQWQQRQTEVELLDADQTEALMGTRNYAGALYYRGAGHVNPLALSNGLARAAIDLGAVVHDTSPVVEFSRNEGRWILITPQGRLSAEKVIIATNAYSGTFAPQLRNTFVPVMSLQCATHPLPEGVRETVMPSDCAASDTRGDMRFFRKDRAGRLVTGAALALPYAIERRAPPWIAKRLAETFPQIPDRRLQYLWSGYVAITQDRLPRIHQLGPGCITAIAYNGRGVALAAAMGAAFADWAEGLPENKLPLPILPIQPQPAYKLFGRWANFALMWFRWKDTRD